MNGFSVPNVPAEHSPLDGDDSSWLLFCWWHLLAPALLDELSGLSPNVFTATEANVRSRLQVKSA